MFVCNVIMKLENKILGCEIWNSSENSSDVNICKTYATFTTTNNCKIRKIFYYNLDIFYL